MSKLKMIYVVMGSTGEYSHRREWPVGAFLKEADANAFVSEADAWAMENGVSVKQEGSMPDYSVREKIARRCPFGEISIDYTGVTWYVMPVPMGRPSKSAGSLP